MSAFNTNFPVPAVISVAAPKVLAAVGSKLMLLPAAMLNVPFVNRLGSATVNDATSVTFTTPLNQLISDPHVTAIALVLSLKV